MSARLEVFDATGRRIVPIEAPVFAIGRRTASDLPVTGTDVSRDHAEITRDGDRFILRDRNSRHGTFVNNHVITERVLAHGDRIRLGASGGVELVFLVGEESATRGTSAPAVDSLRQMTALLDGLRALGTGHVLDEVLGLVLDAAIEVTGAERGFIMLANAEGRLEFTRARARGRVNLAGQTFATSQQIPESVFATGEVRIVNDLLDGSQVMHAGTIALGIRHVLCAPLRIVRYGPADAAPAAPGLIGVLYLDSRERGTWLSPTTRAGVETLATEAAVAIEHARLYREALDKARLEQEMALAAEIQRALLPAARHQGAGLEIAAASVPCRSVGGDFFDYIDLPDGDFGFAIGDVAGKGPPAALLTAALQGLFAAHSASASGPAETFARVNQALSRRAVQNRFATMAYGVLSPGGRLRACNAGHNPPMIFSRTSVRRLEAGGTVLGLFPHAQYKEETLQLDPGDVVLFFSDGVSEALNAAGEEFGDDRITACIGPCVHLDPQVLVDRLFKAVEEFSAGLVQGDDVTALVLRYSGS